MGSYQFDVHLRERYAHAQLVIGIAHQEARETGGQDIFACSCQPAGCAHQVALGDANVEKALRVFLTKVLRPGGIAHIPI